MIIISEETDYMKFYIEAQELILTHWEEVGTHRNVLSLNPNHEIYEHLERAGKLVILVARDSRLALIGYFTMIINTHPRDKTKIIAQDDAIYASKPYRKEFLGYKLTKAALEIAEARADIIAFRAKNGRNPFLLRLGFLPRDTIWTKVAEKHNAQI
jgi:hypothetical protein